MAGGQGQASPFAYEPRASGLSHRIPRTCGRQVNRGPEWVGDALKQSVNANVGLSGSEAGLSQGASWPPLVVFVSRPLCVGCWVGDCACPCRPRLPPSCCSAGLLGACSLPTRLLGAVAGLVLFLTVSPAGKWQAVCRASRNSPGSPPEIGEPGCVRWAGASSMTQFPAPQPPPPRALPSSSSARAAPSLAHLAPQRMPRGRLGLPASGCQLGWSGSQGWVWGSPGPSIKGSHSLPGTDLTDDLDGGPGDLDQGPVVLLASVFPLETGSACLPTCRV